MVKDYFESQFVLLSDIVVGDIQSAVISLRGFVGVSLRELYH